MPQAVRTTPSELDPAARLLAWIYASVVPHALSAERVGQVLSRPELAAVQGPGDATDVERVTEALIAAGLAERRDEGVAAVSDTALPRLRQALAEGWLGAIVDALTASRERYSHDRFEEEAQLRVALLADDAVRFERARKSYRSTKVDWSFLAHAFAADVVARLPPPDLDDALADCLAESINRALPIEPVIAACADGKRVRHLGWIGYARLLQGRYDEFESLFDELPLQQRREKEARFARAATRALAATLHGNDDRALLEIEEGLNVLAGSRKRFPYPKSRAFTLALLSLVRADLPESVELLEKVIAARTWEDERTWELELVDSAMAIKAKRGHWTGRYKPSGTLHVLFRSLAACWVGDAGEWRDPLRMLRARAASSGFAWVAAECDAVLHIADGEAGQDGGHLDLGTATLATLAAPSPAPRRALKLLAEIADSVEDEAEAATDDAERRLVWELHHRAGAVSLSAREQQRKGDVWSKGRQAGVKRLSALAAKEDYLLTQDREAIAGAQKADRLASADQFLGVRSLYALAGHPHVVDAQGRSVEIVRLEPELSVVDDADGGVAVRLAPDRLGTDGEYSFRMVGERRCEVVRFAPAHRRLLNAIGPEGLRVPAADKALLLDTVSALASVVRVQSTVGGATVATEVDADPKPWVWLEPLDTGLTVAVMVEPVPGSGVCFAPGAGGAVVFAGRGSESVQARRDLDAESAALDALVRDCPLLASRPTELRRLVLPEPASCLELLEQLDAAHARCKWPKGERGKFRIVGQASARSFRIRVKSAAEWFGVSGELTVDEDRVLDLQELFERLEANPGARFLALGDGEFLSLTDAFRRQLDDLAHLASKPTDGVARLDRLAVPILDGLLEDVDVDADSAWHAWRDERREIETEEPALPSTLQAELRPYQTDGFRWLSRLSRLGAGACLADDMGLGKTLQALAVLLERAPGGPAIVVAPTSVVPNWVAEAARFAPTLNVRAYAGAAASRAAMLGQAGPFDLFVASYGVLQNDAAALGGVEWHSAVLDEAQAIKNPDAKRTRAALRLKAGFRIVTTGTPVQNNLLDLFSLFGFVNPHLFGNLKEFRNRFLIPIERDGSETARGRLRRLIAPFVLRRLKTDVLADLPGRTEITLHVTLSEAEADLYEALRQRAVAELEAAGEQGGQIKLLAHLTRLRLACCHPSLVMQGADVPPSSKLATFAATLDDLLANRHKVLVFSQFVMHLRLVEEHLVREGIAYQYLDGATPSRTRTERINAFQSGDGDVFLISLKAGGTGLNLTAADYVIHMDPWWNPAVEDQASDRAHRIGQSRPVTIYRLVTEGTIEEEIVDLHHRKRDLAERLLEGADAPSRLDADELMRLLRRPFGVEA